MSLAQPSLGVSLGGGDGDSRALLRAGLGLCLRTVGIWDLKPGSLCVPLCPSSTTFPALDGLHPKAPPGVEPPITFAQGNDAGAPGRSLPVIHVGCHCSPPSLPAVPSISRFTRFTSRSSSPPQQPREVQADSSTACAGAVSLKPCPEGSSATYGL